MFPRFSPLDFKPTSTLPGDNVVTNFTTTQPATSTQQPPAALFFRLAGVNAAPTAQPSPLNAFTNSTSSTQQSTQTPEPAPKNQPSLQDRTAQVLETALPNFINKLTREIEAKHLEALREQTKALEAAQRKIAELERKAEGYQSLATINLQQNAALMQQINQHDRSLNSVQAENKRLKSENERLKSENERLKSDQAQLTQQLTNQQQQIQTLETQLKQQIQTVSSTMAPLAQQLQTVPSTMASLSQQVQSVSELAYSLHTVTQQAAVVDTNSASSPSSDQTATSNQ